MILRGVSVCPGLFAHFIVMDVLLMIFYSQQLTMKRVCKVAIACTNAEGTQRGDEPCSAGEGVTRPDQLP